jgi:hypothetical protein
MNWSDLADEWAKCTRRCFKKYLICVYYLFVNITRFDLYSVLLFCCFYGGNRGKPTPWKSVCACVNITEICIANVMSSVPNRRMLSKTQNGSDFDVLPFLWKCKQNNERDNLKTRNNYSLHVQEVVLCKKINQRWLSINLLYKTFFNWTIQRYFS